ncbi:MAG: enoyl-CoA hydratase/isomerase family protein [Pseudomonadota bacterium]
MSFFPTSNHGETIVVTLTNPDRNTVSAELLEEGAALFQKLAKDPPKGGVVLTGAGEHFSCGMNTKIAASLDAEGVKRAVAAINTYCASLHRLPCALVVALNGNTIGAGGIMALASDWIVAAKGGYKIGLPEAKAGLPFPPVPQIILDYWMDPVWRRRLALSSELIAPEQAVLAGLADELCDPVTLIETAVTQAQTLNAQPGFAACKQQLRARANAEIDTALN